MPNYIYLDYNEAHDYVENMSRKGKKVYWEGWNIMSFRPNPAGFMKKDGAFRDGRWGTIRAIKPNKFGKWRVIEPVGRTRG